MEEKINKEFDEYQYQLQVRSEKKKVIINFDLDKQINDLINDLKNKEVIL